MSNMSRRQFVKRTAAFGAASAAVGKVAWIVRVDPQRASKADVSSTCRRTLQTNVSY